MHDFEEIYNRYAKAVYRTAHQYLMNTAAAEDVTQEVFVKLLLKTPHFRDEAHCKAWLLRVAINLSKNYLKAKRNQSLRFDEAYMDAAARHETDERLDLERELLRLSPAQRAAVYLYYYEGYSVKEIAHMMKMPEGTVKSHLSRAREQLRINLGRE